MVCETCQTCIEVPDEACDGDEFVCPVCKEEYIWQLRIVFETPVERFGIYKAWNE